MNRRLLPTGIQHFPTIREGDFYYVDKTAFIQRLVSEGRFYFLSRPRRFGKSLLVDTIKSLFEGHENLFRGLAIYEHWDWSVKFPVVRLSFGGTYNSPDEIEEDVLAQLEGSELEFGLNLPKTNGSAQVRLRILLRRVHQVTGQQVVVLVDEYDKPILDVLDKPELAKENRDWLRGFYGIIKDCAEHVRFVFVTGISMFTNVNLFSGLNNLSDISLDPQYASICGFTDTDIDTVFAPELFDLERDDISRWYNGYNWRGKEDIYNPFAILQLFRHREFQPYWFESSLPTFLFEMLVARNINPMALEKRVVNMTLVSKFDIANVSVDALMFQTGYVTIADEQRRGNRTLFTLSYPNLEVQLSLNQGLLEYVTDSGQEAEVYAEQLVELLAINQLKNSQSSCRRI